MDAQLQLLFGQLMLRFGVFSQGWNGEENQSTEQNRSSEDEIGPEIGIVQMGEEISHHAAERCADGHGHALEKKENTEGIGQFVHSDQIDDDDRRQSNVSAREEAEQRGVNDMGPDIGRAERCTHRRCTSDDQGEIVEKQSIDLNHRRRG